MRSVLPWLITKHLLLTVLQSEGENSALSISLMTNAAVLIGGWMEAAGWDHMLTALSPRRSSPVCSSEETPGSFVVLRKNRK